ncbi:hypothetical protein H8K90_13370 [Winogradskyella echinorum]|uniref:Lipoprotein n=1 Tax=Winogradskyella echinorum TaxID=538189 RepID=A0ABR6Y3R4_9FLAO|nr:hypothetical protein [Winogradskyella echinorum]MBC3847381.1 hypothetical protein [Winogradskyella echinorum]MBC5751729.1 hypothetical protein [Winogradskyella echinorum]
MKSLKKLFLLFIILAYTTLNIACNNDDDNEGPSWDCGCDSETYDTVPSEHFPNVPIDVQKSGLLFYKTSEIEDEYVNEDQFNNRFWIFQGTEGCNNCQRKFIICDTDLIGVEFDYLKNVTDSVPISFSGDLKLPCIEPFPAPADYSYAEIALNSIAQQ